MHCRYNLLHPKSNWPLYAFNTFTLLRWEPSQKTKEHKVDVCFKCIFALLPVSNTAGFLVIVIEFICKEKLKAPSFISLFCLAVPKATRNLFRIPDARGRDLSRTEHPIGREPWPRTAYERKMHAKENNSCRVHIFTNICLARPHGTTRKPYCVAREVSLSVVGARWCE